jgi:hypothetical protein
MLPTDCYIHDSLVHGEGEKMMVSMCNAFELHITGSGACQKVDQGTWLQWCQNTQGG